MLPVWQHEISPKSQISHILTTVQGSFVDPKGQQMLTKISPLKSTTSQVSKTVSTILLTHFVKKVANFKKSTKNVIFHDFGHFCTFVVFNNFF